MCNGGTSAGPCVVGGVTMPGGLPGPDTNVDGVARPETGLVVKFNATSSHWEDTLGRNWDNAVRFSLPDKDVFAISANANPPVQNGTVFTGVGTVLFNMVVNPASGAVYVSNTDAHNEVRFEGRGVFGGSTVRGHLHEARITVLSGSTATPRHLNKHIDYSVVPSPKSVGQKSLAIPVGMAVSSDGSTLYVTAFGSSKIGIFNTAALENDSFVPDTANQIAVSGGGPSGVVLDEARGRLYVLTRFDNAREDHRSHAAHRDRWRCAPQSGTGKRRPRATLPLRRQLHVQQRRGLLRQLPHLRRLRQFGMGLGRSGQLGPQQPQPVPRRPASATPTSIR